MRIQGVVWTLKYVDVQIRFCLKKCKAAIGSCSISYLQHPIRKTPLFTASVISNYRYRTVTVTRRFWLVAMTSTAVWATERCIHAHQHKEIKIWSRSFAYIYVYRSMREPLVVECVVFNWNCVRHIVLVCTSIVFVAGSPAQQPVSWIVLISLGGALIIVVVIVMCSLIKQININNKKRRFDTNLQIIKFRVIRSMTFYRRLFCSIIWFVACWRLSLERGFKLDESQTHFLP
jgi:hypothetical protein